MYIELCMVHGLLWYVYVMNGVPGGLHRSRAAPLGLEDGLKAATDGAGQADRTCRGVDLLFHIMCAIVYIIYIMLL